MAKPTEKPKRQWLYKKDATPAIFTGEEAISDALDNGWVDTPSKFAEVTIEADVVVTVATMKKDELIALAAREEIGIGSKITVPELKELLKDVEL